MSEDVKFSFSLAACRAVAETPVTMEDINSLEDINGLSSYALPKLSSSTTITSTSTAPSISLTNPFLIKKLTMQLKKGLLGDELV